MTNQRRSLTLRVVLASSLLAAGGLAVPWSSCLDRGRAGSLTPSMARAATGEADPSVPAIAGAARSVLDVHCYRCHGENGVAEKDVYVLDRERLVDSGLVVPGDVSASRLLEVVARDEMPEDEDLPDEKKSVLRSWVAAGAPGWAPPSRPRPLLGPAAVRQSILDDLRSLDGARRPFTRYLTLTHLSDAGVTDAELAGYRAGLSKLLNSLSWARRVTIPTDVGGGGTVLRIDLRDYDWTAEGWRRIVQTYPYSCLLDADREIQALTGAELSHVRADWLVAAASVPPLYHTLLGLPATARDLEKRLRVGGQLDLREPSHEGRGGVRASGVSRHNRVVQRQETPFGAYWKSFDFARSDGSSNVFRRPLTFSAAGSEMIFSLPNGLQGYFITDAVGRRLDEAPVEIVRQPGPDVRVRNGRSCMGCHHRGIVPFRDGVRQALLAQDTDAVAYDREHALRLYRPQHELDAWFREDTERFRAAVAATGGKLSVKRSGEPIAALAAKHERALAPVLAAAEVGLTQTQLLQAISVNPRLRALGLAQLLAPAGGIKRDAWEEAFPRVTRELGACIAQWPLPVRVLVELPALKPSGKAWDAGTDPASRPDPFVVVDGVSLVAQRCKDSFQCELSVSALRETLSILVIDKDVSFDDRAAELVCRVGARCERDGVVVTVR